MGNKCKDLLYTRSTLNENSLVMPVSQKKSLRWDHMSCALFGKAQLNNNIHKQLLEEDDAGRESCYHKLSDARAFLTDTPTDICYLTASSSTSHLSPTEVIPPTRILQRLLNMSRPTAQYNYIELNKELHEVASRFTACELYYCS